MRQGAAVVASADYILVIGDKNFSSWSLRPWLALKQCRISFDEVCVRLRQPESKAAILKHSPAGKVPVLKAGALVIWDSLAILEFLAEQHAGNAAIGRGQKKHGTEFRRPVARLGPAALTDGEVAERVVIVGGNEVDWNGVRHIVGDEQLLQCAARGSECS